MKTTALLPVAAPNAWPPAVVPGDDWATLDDDAAVGLHVEPDVAAAAAWTNSYIRDLRSR